jgi:hypothetical protein
MREVRAGRLLRVLFLVFFFVVLILKKIAVLSNFSFFFLIIFIVVKVFGDDVQMHRMRLRHFQLGFALRTTEDLAFLDFVFIDVDFGGTLWATDHGSILRRVVGTVGAKPTAPRQSVLYTPRCEVNCLRA